MTTNSLRAFGVGLVALDLLVSADPVRPIQARAGGTCGNVLSILSYLGWDAYPIARLDDGPTSQRIEKDLVRWGVNTDFLRCAPACGAPIVVQRNEVRNGATRHRFVWHCPRCGRRLPGFRPITLDAASQVGGAVAGSSVFFMDRLSRAALALAARASRAGALVVFEPSGRSDPKLFADALGVAHVVKYADDRLGDAGGTMDDGAATLLEIQTLGARGLRFRHRLAGAPGGWRELPAIDAGNVVDTCGAGDWCTAGLLDRAARDGRKGFEAAGVDALVEALVYGQTLAARNCRSEGARGAMYEADGKPISDWFRATDADDPEPGFCPVCQSSASAEDWRRSEPALCRGQENRRKDGRRNRNTARQTTREAGSLRTVSVRCSGYRRTE